MSERLHIAAKKAPTPVRKPKGTRLQRRYLDQLEPATVSFANEKPLSRPQQSNLTASSLASPPRGHSFGRMTVWPAVSPRMQPKPALGQPNNAYEQEADRVADQVMRMAELRVQAKYACGGEAGPDGECAACKAQRLGIQHQAQNETPAAENVVQAQSEAEPSAAAPNLESRLGESRGSGQALAEDTRSAMEFAFGVNFGGVRVHTGSEVVQLMVL